MCLGGGAAIAVDLHAGIPPRHGGRPLWQRQREWGVDAESQDSSGLYFSVLPLLCAWGSWPSGVAGKPMKVLSTQVRVCQVRS